MSFHLSLASLVDQGGAELPSLLLLPNTTFASIAQAFANSSTESTLGATTLPQIFVVNPTGDNIFRHVDYENAHAAIVGLIYVSMWMGALGWDIVSTVSFDVRVIRETHWSSSFSSIYSIAYLLSRYFSLAWLITAVTNSVIMTDRCDAWMKGSTALFSVGISATMLVFCLRTCSIWHMEQRIVSLVVSSWLVVAACAVLLPVMSYGSQLPTSDFCAWHFNGLYVVGVFVALLVFDLLCLILTVCKLNKAGWRGLLHGLFPSSRHNLDAEDIKIMLVQKTTAFFAIQFLFLISALLMYVLTDTYAYRMMNIVASVAVASSMAGRIFRRAWRQTRELAPYYDNRPPSYFPAWAEEHPQAAVRRSDIHSSASPSNRPSDGGQLAANLDKDQFESSAYYVEGEFRPQFKARSMSSSSLRSMPRLSIPLAATHQLRQMETGHAGTADATADVSSITSSTIIIARDFLTTPIGPEVGSLCPGSGSQIAPAPAYSRRLGSAASSRPRTRDQEVSVSSTPTRQSSSGEPGLAVPAASTSESSSAAPARMVHPASRDRRSAVMEEKRRTYLTSPPLSAGVKLNKKEVYDVESIKAAARLEPRPTRPLSSTRRPATADSLVSGYQRASRPKTAPSLPSFSTSQSSAEPRKQVLVTSKPMSGLATKVSPGAASLPGTTPETDEDALLAFLNTVEQDSRDRICPQSQDSGEGRPRTSRGNTASSCKSDDLQDGEESDLSTVHEHHIKIRGRSASASVRPRTGADSRDDINIRSRATSSGSSRSREGSSERKGSSGRRPSTAVGEAVKPFGFGVKASLSREESLARTSAISDDEEGEAEAEAELGSVIEQVYAKLAARAGVPRDPPR